MPIWKFLKSGWCVHETNLALGKGNRAKKCTVVPLLLNIGPDKIPKSLYNITYIEVTTKRLEWEGKLQRTFAEPVEYMTLDAPLDFHSFDTSQHLMCPNTSCPYRNDKAEQEDFEQHIKKCMYKKVACPHKACTVFVYRKTMKEHLDVCRFRPSKCLNESCTVSVSADQKHSHKLVCEYERVKCPKCKVLVFRKNLTNHTVQCKKLEMIKIRHKNQKCASKYTTGVHIGPHFARQTMTIDVLTCCNEKCGCVLEINKIKKHICTEFKNDINEN